MNEHIPERKVEEFCNYIVQKRNGLVGFTKVEDLDEEELKAFVEEQFNEYGLNFMVIGEFNKFGTATIDLHLKTGTSLKSNEEFKRILDAEINTYLRKIEDDMKVWKNLVYKHLQHYQAKQKPDPFK